MTTQHNFDPKTFFITEENFNRRDLACMFFVEKSQLAVEERKPITFFLTGTFLERNETFDSLFYLPLSFIGFSFNKKASNVKYIGTWVFKHYY